MKRPHDLAPECEHCDSDRWVWTHDPSLDGHGGLNGGGYTYYRCAHCNPTGQLPMRDAAGNPWPQSFYH